MASNIANHTFLNTDVAFTYEPSVSLSSGTSLFGWQVNKLDSYTYFTSHSGSSVQLSFEGIAVYLYGSAACSFTVNINSVDLAISDSPTVTPDSTLLFKQEGLLQTNYDVNLTVGNTAGLDAQFRFDYAIVTMYTGEEPLVGKYTGESSMLHYDGSWQILPNGTAYTSSIGASVFLNFAGDSMTIVGPVYPGPGSYNVTLDNATSVVKSSSPIYQPSSQFFYTGLLDPSQEHSLTITNGANTPFGIEYIAIWEWSAVYPTAATSGPPSSLTSSAAVGASPAAALQKSSHSSVAKIVAPIVSIIGGLLLIAALWALRRRRRGRAALAPSGPFRMRLARTFEKRDRDSVMMDDLHTDKESTLDGQPASKA
ncbi:hypothetical protein CERSUDRAFT_97196 [Gelatoporia subvermispora B]|uniref:Transmembrane protein n=1 Tax=Ceriporiopsis subvermispora (strain B) TaxID=914234 RepID=M2R7E3_CERS8|nr:hypothetical protein CERSUDRAFT_97196 [Gelatoporia subvermispora B]